jgi:putative membrane protein
VLLVGVVSAALSFLGFFAHMRTGGTPMIVTPGPGVVFAVATAILIWSGMAVRRLRADKDTWIDAIGAMRVAVFARTSALVGAGLVGVLIGVMGVSLTQLEAAPMVSNAIASGVSSVIGVVWVIVALVVERWCIINPDDDTSGSNKRNAAA